MTDASTRMDRNYEYIVAEEERFATALAASILPRPPLNVWMILIPIILVFWFMRSQKIMEGRQDFVGHYLVTRRRALSAALKAAREGRAPDIRALVRESSTPENARQEHESLLTVLVDHYRALLAASGEDFVSLARGAYGNRTAYLLAMNALGAREEDLNRALAPAMETTPDAGEVMQQMQCHSVDLRRARAEEIFP